MPPPPPPPACVRPGTLRARFGASSASPGVHVTDLPGDGRVEAAFVGAVAAMQESGM